MRDQLRLDREREYHDARYGSDVRRRVAKYYTGAPAGPQRYLQLVGDVAARGRVLEYGCGTGSAAFALATNGATVTGIDISSVAIGNARAQATELGLNSLDFQVMNAEALELPDSSFDLVCGSGILHHLDLDVAFAEIARVLRPRGRAIFYEPLGHNVVINLFRWLTPKLRTSDEHPLMMQDLETAGRLFNEVRGEYFNLAALAVIPLRGLPGGARLAARAARADAWLFHRFPRTRRYAWTVVLDLASPRKMASGTSGQLADQTRSDPG